MPFPLTVSRFNLIISLHQVTYKMLPTITWNHFDADYVDFLKGITISSRACNLIILHCHDKVTYVHCSLCFAPETHRQRSYYGTPDYTCMSCGAIFWYGERNKHDSTQRRIVYNLCRKAGKVALPSFSERHPLLERLLRFDGDGRNKKCLHKIRQRPK
jgi:hypothetical protein